MSDYNDHAVSSAAAFGGVPSDYILLHRHLDRFKAHIGDFRHRAMTHHSAGIWETIEHFGDTIKNSDGNFVSTKAVCEQHVIEDLGRIPSVSDWLRLIRPERWMSPNLKNGEADRQEDLAR